MCVQAFGTFRDLIAHNYALEKCEVRIVANA